MVFGAVLEWSFRESAQGLESGPQVVTVWGLRWHNVGLPVTVSCPVGARLPYLFLSISLSSLSLSLSLSVSLSCLMVCRDRQSLCFYALLLGITMLHLSKR